VPEITGGVLSRGTAVEYADCFRPRGLAVAAVVVVVVVLVFVLVLVVVLGLVFVVVLELVVVFELVVVLAGVVVGVSVDVVSVVVVHPGWPGWLQGWRLLLAIAALDATPIDARIATPAAAANLFFPMQV
jgi:hypothetical protein